jgi:multimeric flavodoxin WrbA
MKLLAIYGSTRAGGNSDLLLDSFLEGANASNCQIKRLYVRKLNIFPCTGCGECEKGGKCPLKDDMQTIYPLLLETDTIVVTTPIYFYGVPSQFKALIDRSQLLWHKSKEKNDFPLKPGYLIAVAGSKGQRLFDGVILTVNYFFLTFGARLKESFTYRGIDGFGAIKKHPKALKEVYEVGEKLCQRSL